MVTVNVRSQQNDCICNAEISLWGAALYHQVQRTVALKQREEEALIVAVAPLWELLSS